MNEQQHIDDLMDARAEIRRWRKAVANTRAAAAEAKSELEAANARSEKILDEIEAKQGRLSFDVDAKPNGRPRKRSDQAAARSV